MCRNMWNQGQILDLDCLLNCDFLLSLLFVNNEIIEDD
jgi:hypothetical protein